MKKILALLLALASPAFGQAVQQSGNITPGHIATWVTTGVVGDGGAAGGGATLLGSFTVNDFVCANATSTTPSIIDCGFSATGTNNWVGLQNFNGGATVAGTFGVGGGTPLSLTAGSPPVTGATQFIPPATRTTAVPVVAIERTDVFSGGPSATASPTLYIGTLTNFGSTPSSWGQGILSEVVINSNAAASGQSYMEGIRTTCTIATPITAFTSCWGQVSQAVSGGSYVSLVGIESEAINSTGVDAPNPTQFLTHGNYAMSYLASNNGTNISDGGFIVNPFLAKPFQVGFYCPREQNGAGNEAAYACFEADITATYGLNLVRGTWGTAAINATGFVVTPTGITNINGAASNNAETLNVVGDIAVLNAASGHGLHLYQAGSASSWGTLSFDNTKGFTSTWPLFPTSDNALSLGGVSSRWSNLYAVLATVTGSASAPAFVSTGTPPTLTGSCAVVAGTQTGGSTVGKFAVPAGNCATTTTVIAALPTAPTGWACDAHDLTTPTSIWDQTATGTGSVTFTIRSVNAAAADIVLFKCMAY